MNPWTDLVQNAHLRTTLRTYVDVREYRRNEAAGNRPVRFDVAVACANAIDADVVVVRETLHAAALVRA